jgi:NO-binding membrane sensor protein with MHYT domain
MEIRAISHADFPVIATHEVRLVVLSVVIAVIASYTALDLQLVAGFPCWVNLSESF